jgi:hypothetical protein
MRSQSLSHEQSEALEQLWAVTASETTAAKERDERLLRENGWDVQVGPACPWSLVIITFSPSPSL